MRKKLLVLEASYYVGVHEHGVNDGEFVRLFQSTIGPAAKEPWCMSFVQFCVNKIDKLASCIDPTVIPHVLFPSEHCLTVWKAAKFATFVPSPGCIAIWQHEGSQNGHAGIVESFDRNTNIFHSIEGNTNDAGDREGDGVFLKKRHMDTTGSKLKLLGFLDPWP